MNLRCISHTAPGSVFGPFLDHAMLALWADRTSSYSSQDQNLGNKSYVFPFLTRPKSRQQIVLLPIPHKTKISATNRTSSHSSQDQNLGNKSYVFPFLTRPKSRQQVVLLPIPHRTKILATNRTSSRSSQETVCLLIPHTQDQHLGNKSYLGQWTGGVAYVYMHKYINIYIYISYIYICICVYTYMREVIPDLCYGQYHLESPQWTLDPTLP